MKLVSFKILICGLLLLALPLSAQPLADSLDAVYGPDPVLVNGIRYDFRPPPGTSGHPFLLGTLYYAGEAVVRGKTFTGLRLNVDIVNQLVLMSYPEAPGRTNVISLNTAWLTSFSAGGMHFTVVRRDGEEDRIMQQLGSGPLKVLVSWWKTLKPGESYGALSYKFSDAKRKMFLLDGNEMRPFRNNRSFLSLFGEADQGKIKAFLRENRFRIRTLPDDRMTRLIDAVGQMTSR